MTSRSNSLPYLHLAFHPRTLLERSRIHGRMFEGFCPAVSQYRTAFLFMVVRVRVEVIELEVP